MSAKNVDKHNRLRSVTVGFRVSPEEAKLLDSLVAVSGLTKQDYIIKRLAEREITVEGNPKVYQALSLEMKRILQELRRINDSNEMSEELIDLIEMISTILYGMKGADVNDG